MKVFGVVCPEMYTSPILDFLFVMTWRRDSKSSRQWRFKSKSSGSWRRGMLW